MDTYTWLNIMNFYDYLNIIKFFISEKKITKWINFFIMYKKLEYYFVIYIYGKEVVRKRLNCLGEK
jgi:hypothetical protein